MHKIVFALVIVSIYPHGRVVKEMSIDPINISNNLECSYISQEINKLGNKNIRAYCEKMEIQCNKEGFCFD
jgi:hypothetical protein